MYLVPVDSSPKRVIFKDGKEITVLTTLPRDFRGSLCEYPSCQPHSRQSANVLVQITTPYGLIFRHLCYTCLNSLQAR